MKIRKYIEGSIRRGGLENNEAANTGGQRDGNKVEEYQKVKISRKEETSKKKQKKRGQTGLSTKKKKKK